MLLLKHGQVKEATHITPAPKSRHRLAKQRKMEPSKAAACKTHIKRQSEPSIRTIKRFGGEENPYLLENFYCDVARFSPSVRLNPHQFQSACNLARRESRIRHVIRPDEDVRRRRGRRRRGITPATEREMTPYLTAIWPR